EHGFEIEGRAADDLEHVGGGCLLLQRFTQLVEQPYILNGDDGLRGEVLHKFNLLVGETSGLPGGRWRARRSVRSPSASVPRERYERRPARPWRPALARVRCKTALF